MQLQKVGTVIILCCYVLAVHSTLVTTAWILPQKSILTRPTTYSRRRKQISHRFTSIGTSPNHPSESSIQWNRGSSTSSSSSSIVWEDLPRLSVEHLDRLQKQKYVVIPNFLSPTLVEELRSDVYHLRIQQQFKKAGIGQDTTNQFNADIRVAETCFIGPDKLKAYPSTSRNHLYNILDIIRKDIEASSMIRLDTSLTELLYAYYPMGGFYQRHRDAIPGSASTLRKYSLLLYLNQPDWDIHTDGGALRLYFDSNPDNVVSPINEDSSHVVDIIPMGGTLVLFPSDALPHAVLNTQRERMAVVGWFNRPVQISDVVELSVGSSTTLQNPMRILMLMVAVCLVIVGMVQLTL